MLKNLFIYSGFLILFSWWLYRKLYHPDETGVYKVSQDEMVLFDSIEGPKEPNVVLKEIPTDWMKYSGGSHSRVAVLLTDTNSSWLAMVHGLKSAGIPFLVTQNYKAALKHQMILVYPTLSAKVLKVEALKSVLEHPRKGGILLAFNVMSQGLSEVFGFKEGIPLQKHYEIRFERSIKENNLSEGAREWIVRLGNKETGADPIPTIMYSSPTNKPVAYFEDNTPAIVSKSYEKGKTYAFGMDLGYFLHKSYNNIRDEIGGMGKAEPTADAVLNLIKNIYLENCSAAVTLSPVPENKKLILVLTHNVNSKKEFYNAMQFARYERSRKFSSSYFIQSKYISDFSGPAFLTPEIIDYLHKMNEWGMEIGSQTVTSTSRFSGLSGGSGKESYPAYRPYIYNKSKIYNATVTGEMRVSKHLLERLGGIPINSFRSGYYQVPQNYPQLLQASGYLYSSSTNTNRSFTHRPFRMNYDHENATETNIFEFPVTLDDRFLRGNPNEQLGRTIEMAYDLASYEGMMLLSLGTDTLSKLQFEKELLSSVKDFSWIGSLGDFAAWWSARDQVEVDLVEDSLLDIVIPVRMKGLTIQIPPGMRMYNYEPAGLPIDQYDDRLWIYDYRGKARIYLTRNKK